MVFKAAPVPIVILLLLVIVPKKRFTLNVGTWLLVEMVKKSIVDGTGPFGTMLAIGLGIAAVSFLKSKMDSVKLAKGGLAFGPTLATVGDNRGASYDPEVIAPLSKLKSMLGDVGGGDPYVLTTRVAGSDLLVIMEKARNVNTRIR